MWQKPYKSEKPVGQLADWTFNASSCWHMKTLFGTGNPSLLGVTLAGAPVLEVGRTNLRMLGASVFQKFWVLCYYVTMWHNMCLSFPNRTPKEINISQKFKTNKVVFPLMFIQCRRNDLKAFENPFLKLLISPSSQKKMGTPCNLYHHFHGAAPWSFHRRLSAPTRSEQTTLAKKLPNGMKIC